jgi:integrase
LPPSNAPRFEQFCQEFLDSVRHPNTRKRYSSSVGNLKIHFGNTRLSEINPEGIDEFKKVRLADKVRAATVNRDLAVLRQMLNIAEKRRLISSTPFREVMMLEERKERRQPHILSFKEEAKLLAVSPDFIRALAILILDTGLRSGKEALALRWHDIDFTDITIRIKSTKTPAGFRLARMTKRCLAELFAWKKKLGPAFSEFVFANPNHPETHLKNVRRAWPKALKAAGLEYFWIYDLRHTHTSRLAIANVSPIFIAQMIGHSSPNILSTYAKANEESQRLAICKLDALLEAQCVKPEIQSRAAQPIC